jgi:hypothetical protein
MLIFVYGFILKQKLFRIAEHTTFIILHHTIYCGFHITRTLMILPVESVIDLYIENYIYGLVFELN